MAIPYLACMVLTASFYHLPPRVLPTIQSIEGGHVGQIEHNVNNTDDLGVMQVNTIWLEPLSRAARLGQSEVKQRLLWDACFNIAAAALILRKYLDEPGTDLMRAIGNYHSHTPALNMAYSSQAWRTAARLFADVR
jgi:Transglycosylase SLT domain